MSPTLAELIDSVPEEAPDERSAEHALEQLLAELGGKGVPTGRITRLWTMGALQAKIAVAYLAWWLRSFGDSADERERKLNEAHLRSAIQVLGGMGYLRGAMMKVGQILAHYPDVVPQEFADVLGRLHFEAPPMHFSLLREFMRNELGGDPEDIFEGFETEAFAAASFGQVHRARLRDNQRPVAIKVQYPNIARTIHADLRNMKVALFPMRLGGDWDSLKAQFEEIERMLQLETDYENEADNLRIARLAFREADGIAVPRVYPEFSTKRILTMDLLEGVHLEDYLRSNPPQEERDRYGQQLTVSSFRLSYGSHLLHADPHPGNYLFMPDGRLGLLDFGCCHRYSDEDIDYLTASERAIFDSPEAMREAAMRGADLKPKQRRDEKRVKLLEQLTAWLAEPMLHEGAFDFGNPDYFKRGMELFAQILKRRYVRSLTVNIWLSRVFFGLRAMLTHLGARVDFGDLLGRESTVVTSRSNGDSQV